MGMKGGEGKERRYDLGLRKCAPGWVDYGLSWVKSRVGGYFSFSKCWILDSLHTHKTVGLR